MQIEDTSEALARMRTHGVRRLPVTGAGGRLVGIVTLDDLLRLVIADARALRRDRGQGAGCSSACCR